MQQPRSIGAVRLKVASYPIGESREAYDAVAFVIVLDLAEQSVAPSVESGTHRAGVVVVVKHIG